MQRCTCREMESRALLGDCREVLRTLPAACVQTCVTSPPYFGLRDYGVAGQIGLEPTPAAYVAELVSVFREVRRVLSDDGTLWVNLGDGHAKQSLSNGDERPPCKPKDLLGIPWRVAFALQDDGWYLRSDIIWSKTSAMPEAVKDRPTRSHEYVFLLSKNARYYYDAEAVAEAAHDPDGFRYAGDYQDRIGHAQAEGRAFASPVRTHVGNTRTSTGSVPHFASAFGGKRNRRSVWTVTPKPFKGAHFATFPPELPEICIRAGSREGDMVLDPFAGSGTTLMVATELRRRYIGIELQPAYLPIIEERVRAPEEHNRERENAAYAIVLAEAADDSP